MYINTHIYNWNTSLSAFKNMFDLEDKLAESVLLNLVNHN